MSNEPKVAVVTSFIKSEAEYQKVLSIAAEHQDNPLLQNLPTWVELVAQGKVEQTGVVMLGYPDHSGFMSPSEYAEMQARGEVETVAYTDREDTVVDQKQETVDEDVEFAQYAAHDAVSALQVEIVDAIERLAALYKRVAKLPAAIDTLNKSDIDDADAQTLFGIQMLAPVPQDMEADVLGTILHQGNIFADGEGETCIGWVVADVEGRVQAIEEDIVLRTRDFRTDNPEINALVDQMLKRTDVQAARSILGAIFTVSKGSDAQRLDLLRKAVRS